MTPDRIPGSWVAFDEQGFPFGFLKAWASPLHSEAVEEFPTAHTIRLITDETEISHLLNVHRGVES
jgi:hypothetical protein